MGTIFTNKEKLQLFIDWIAEEHIIHDKKHLDVNDICMTDLLGIAYRSVASDVKVAIGKKINPGYIERINGH